MQPDPDQKDPSLSDDAPPADNVSEEETSDDDVLMFAADDEIESSDERSVDDFWNVLIVDDDQEVHNATTFVLNEFEFQNKPIAFHHAYSAAEGKELLLKTPGIEIILLDVVMETPHAGLEMVKWIRGEFKNKSVRIILRTGQPGEAPEREVIRDYDINDYKSKTELTATKLFTVLYASCRAYQDIIALEKTKDGLRKIIDASAPYSAQIV